MKKILFLGDSISDMGRTKILDRDYNPFNLGLGFVQMIAGELMYNYPLQYTIVNRGISGNRSVDLYARIKKDVWNENPDYLSILVGTNDVWHEIELQNGVDIERFEKVYSMMIEDTLKALPNVKIILCEPFILEGAKTTEKMNEFLAVYDYAKIVKKLANKYNLPFVLLQDKLNQLSKEYGVENYLYDGVHPNSAGAKLIATEWLKVFNQLEGRN